MPTDSTPPAAPSLVPRFQLPGWTLIALASIGFALAVAFFLHQMRPRTYVLKIAAGDRLGRRYQVAEFLAEEARAKRVALALVETKGSGDALKLLSEGKIDFALIQGGQGTPSHVRQVAALGTEPLHLLVKKELAAKVEREGFAALRGKRLNLSTKESGTRRLATEVLTFAGMQSGVTFQDEDAAYSTLEMRPYYRLPDALFVVSMAPSPVVEYLTERHGYRLVSIPFAAALALRDFAIRPASIPAYTYGVSPPAPVQEIATVGNHLILVARDTTPPDAVTHVLEATFAGGFARKANLPELSEEEMLRLPELPIHPGATAYLNRNKPFLTSDRVELLENSRNFLGSLVVAVYFLGRWAKRRRYRGFDGYLKEVTRIECEVLQLEREATPNLSHLLRLRGELSEVKTEALEKFAAGELKGEELMSGFLQHVTDVRDYLSDLVVAERNRIASESRDTIPNAEQDERFRDEWAAAIAQSE